MVHLIGYIDVKDNAAYANFGMLFFKNISVLIFLHKLTIVLSFDSRRLSSTDNLKEWKLVSVLIRTIPNANQHLAFLGTLSNFIIVLFFLFVFFFSEIEVRHSLLQFCLMITLKNTNKRQKLDRQRWWFFFLFFFINTSTDFYHCQITLLLAEIELYPSAGSHFRIFLCVCPFCTVKCVRMRRKKTSLFSKQVS